MWIPNRVSKTKRWWRWKDGCCCHLGRSWKDKDGGGALRKLQDSLKFLARIWRCCNAQCAHKDGSKANDGSAGIERDCEAWRSCSELRIALTRLLIVKWQKGGNESQQDFGRIRRGSNKPCCCWRWRCWLSWWGSKTSPKAIDESFRWSMLLQWL